VLKNALDRVYAEWNNKAAAFVSYGHDGGVRAVEQLRQVVGALQTADVATAVALHLRTDFVGFHDVSPASYQEAALDQTLDQLVAWTAALASLRHERAGGGS
jgi:NAD(P)H-dependent FMN reductase